MEKRQKKGLFKRMFKKDTADVTPPSNPDKFEIEKEIASIQKMLDEHPEKEGQPLEQEQPKEVELPDIPDPESSDPKSGAVVVNPEEELDQLLNEAKDEVKAVEPENVEEPEKVEMPDDPRNLDVETLLPESMKKKGETKMPSRVDKVLS